MSDSNRLLFTAAAIGLVSLVIAANVVAFGYIFSVKPPPGPDANANLIAQQAMAVAAIVQLSLTTVGLVLLGLTLHYTRRAVDEARVATQVANKGVRAAVKANKSFARTSRAQLRAYIGIQKVEMTDLDIGKAPGAKVRFQNFGATPAYVTHVWGHLKAGPAPVTDLKSLAEVDPDASEFSLAPGVGQTISPHGQGQMTQPMIDVLKSGLGEIIVYGEIRYLDIFEYPHVTRFRFRIGGTFGVPSDRSMSPLPDGNEAD